MRLRDLKYPIFGLFVVGLYLAVLVIGFEPFSLGNTRTVRPPRPVAAIPIGGSSGRRSSGGGGYGWGK